MPFEKGHPGGPGRPKGSVKKFRILMADVLHDAEFDWVTDFADALKTLDDRRIDLYKHFAPYLFAIPRVKEIEIKSDSQEGSVRLADAQMRRIINERAGSSGMPGLDAGTVDSGRVESRGAIPEVPANSAQI